MFFFSSRRRHTRWTGDWSSDVCSSDLVGVVVVLVHAQAVEALRLGELQLVEELVVEAVGLLGIVEVVGHVHPHGAIAILEVLGQEAVRHQVEEADFHGAPGVGDHITRITPGALTCASPGPTLSDNETRRTRAHPAVDPTRVRANDRPWHLQTRRPARAHRRPDGREGTAGQRSLHGHLARCRYAPSGVWPGLARATPGTRRAGRPLGTRARRLRGTGFTP